MVADSRRKRAAVKAAPRRAGRPAGSSDYTPELAEAICDRLMLGESLRQICLDPAMPGLRTVFDWLAAGPGHPAHDGGFPHRYARARRLAAEIEFDELLRIADDSTRDMRDDGEGGKVPDHAAVQRARLMCDARKWRLARLHPEKYGDAARVEHTGEGGGPVRIVEVPLRPQTAAEWARKVRPVRQKAQ